MTEDITYCVARCKHKPQRHRDPRRIKAHDIPHSFADFSKVCDGYVKEVKE